MPRSLLALLLLVLLECVGCATQPVLPAKNAPTVTVTKFQQLQEEADRVRGESVKLAGKIISVSHKGTNLIILADWIPFPKDMERGPEVDRQQPRRRFVLRFPGPLDVAGQWTGNKFVLLGRVEGTTQMGGTEPLIAPVPYVVAQCIHVWETGQESIKMELDQYYDTFPILERTACARS